MDQESEIKLLLLLLLLLTLDPTKLKCDLEMKP